MNLDQLLRDSAPDTAAMRQHTDGLRATVVREFAATPAIRPAAPRRRRWAAGLAAAAAAATAYVVVSPGGPAINPAYAVEQQADGDVVVTIHRLEDADGLEAALQEHGIDADVSFQEVTGNELKFPAPDFDGLPPRDPGVKPDCASDSDPATLRHEGDDWVVFIPADSPLQDRAVDMRTSASGSLVLAYESVNDPWTYCAVLS